MWPRSTNPMLIVSFSLSAIRSDVFSIIYHPYTIQVDGIWMVGLGLQGPMLQRHRLVKRAGKPDGFLPSPRPTKRSLVSSFDGCGRSRSRSGDKAVRWDRR